MPDKRAVDVPVVIGACDRPRRGVRPRGAGLVLGWLCLRAQAGAVHHQLPLRWGRPRYGDLMGNLVDGVPAWRRCTRWLPSAARSATVLPATPPLDLVRRCPTPPAPKGVVKSTRCRQPARNVAVMRFSVRVAGLIGTNHPPATGAQGSLPLGVFADQGLLLRHPFGPEGQGVMVTTAGNPFRHRRRRPG